MNAAPLVLLPGMMCDARLFGPQLARFSRERAVAVAPLAHHDTVEALARATLDVCPPRFALAGLSMGGIVAMSMLALAPERVTHLALLDTNHLAEDVARHAVRRRQMAEVKTGGLAAVMRDEMKPRYLGSRADRATLLDLCLEMALDLGPEAFVNQSRALMDRPDRSDVLARWSGPALVVCGEEDGLCPPERHDAMAVLMRDATRLTIEGAGHLTTLEAPDAVNEALARLLAR